MTLRTLTSYLCAAFVALAVAGVPVTRAAETGAVQDTKQMTKTLAGAKDEGSSTSTDLGFRIETFKQVVGLAASETEELRVQVLSAERTDEIASTTRAWRNSVIARLDEALAFYDDEKQYLSSHEGALTLENVQERAKTFKKWRDDVYAPLYQEAAGYVMLHKGKQVLAVAAERWRGISKDMDVLKKAGFQMKDLTPLFASSTAYLKHAEDAYTQAESSFRAQYMATTTAGAATSTEAAARASASVAIPATGNASSSADIPLDDVGYKEWSIKDLIRESFQNVKDAYQIFIEMSSLVRKLL